MPKSVFHQSPATARILPFAVYIGFLAIESALQVAQNNRIVPAIDPHWLYAAQIALTAATIAWLWPKYQELQTSSAKPAAIFFGLAAGVVVLILWRVLDAPWATIGEGRPVETARSLFSSSATQSLLFAATRVIGAALVVPIMEELFWRSFVMRWAQRSDFLNLAPAQVGVRALLISAVLFGFEHHLIVAGIMAGLIYGALYRRTGNLWIVILAHATTNALLEFLPS